MKRSKHITIITLLASTAILAGCSEEVDPSKKNVIYTDVKACTERSGLTEEKCKELQLVAEQTHEKTAPKYKSLEECNKVHGNCKEPTTGVTNPQANGGGSFFIPFMMGYMMNGGAAVTPGVAPSVRPLSAKPAAPAPFVAPGSPNAPSVSAPASSGAPAATGGATSRGGFGSTASSSVSAGG